MNAIKKILVVASPDAANLESVRRAVRVARRNDAELSALTVYQELPVLLRNLVTKHDAGWLDRHVEAIKQQFELAVAAAAGGYPVASISARSGDLALEAIRDVLRHGYGLVVKEREAAGTGHGLTGADRRLLRKCPCPVWLVGPPPPEGLGRVLAAVDLKPEPESLALNQKIVRLAKALLGQDEGEIHIAHAWNDMGLIYWGRKLPLDEYERYVAGVREGYEELLREFVQSLDVELPENQIHLIGNEPGAGIPALAQQLRISTIVMGTVARTGLAGMLMGNTAELVLQNIECSVLAVKPDGFESPVRLA